MSVKTQKQLGKMRNDLRRFRREHAAFLWHSDIHRLARIEVAFDDAIESWVGPKSRRVKRK